jgi:hypothetical protein
MMSIVTWSRYHKSTLTLILDKQSGTPKTAASTRARRVNSSCLTPLWNQYYVVNVNAPPIMMSLM